MMFGYGGHLSAWGWFGMTIGMVAFWGLVFLAIYWLGRSFAGTNQPSTSRVPPEQLVAERFARGEIDEAEYRTRLDTLAGMVRS